MNNGKRLLQQTTCDDIECNSPAWCTESPFTGASCTSCAAFQCFTGSTCVVGQGCVDLDSNATPAPLNSCKLSSYVWK